MKVALVSTDDSIKVKSGGKHVHQELLYKGLENLGIDVDRIYYHPREGIFRRILHKFLRLTSPEESVKRRFSEIVRFFEDISFSFYDIVHSHDVLSALGTKANNIVLTVHGYLARETFDYSTYLDKNRHSKLFDWITALERKAILKARKIVAVDTRIKKYIVETFGIPQDKIIVLYNAVDVETFHPVDEMTKIDLRKNLRIPESSFVVLLPRRFVPKNGVLYAAEAFSKLKSDDYFFIIAGRGFLKNQMLKILKDNENFIIKENLPHDQIVDYYMASDMVLIPSILSNDVEEATSLSMLEGMACGKIVVCTNVGGMKEVIKHMENGILINQKNVDEIVEAIIFVKKNLKKMSHIGRNAREYVVKNHSYLSYSKKVLEIYESLLKR